MPRPARAMLWSTLVAPLLGGAALLWSPAVVASPAPRPAVLASATVDATQAEPALAVTLESTGLLRIVAAEGSPRAARQLSPSGAAAASGPPPRLRAERTSSDVWIEVAWGPTVWFLQFSDDQGLRAPIELTVGPVGDGERTVHAALEGGVPVRWQTSPGVRRCDGADRLFSERWSPATGRFVLEQRLQAAAGSWVDWRVATGAARAHDASMLQLFSWVATSTEGAARDAEGGPRADLLGAPSELSDGDLSSAWSGRAGDWVTARTRDRARPLLGVRVSGWHRPTPQRLALVFDGGHRTELQVPAGDAPLLLEPATPLSTSCVSLVLLEGAPSEGSRLGEVQLLTPADGAEGPRLLVEEVAGDTPGRTGAMQALSAAGRGAEGERVLQALSSGLDTATGPGRRRLIEVLAGIGSPSTAPLLTRASSLAGQEERPLVRQALLRLGTAAIAPLRSLLADETQSYEARADAATVLGALLAGAPQTQGPDRGAALQPLVGAASSEEPQLRRALREALTAAAATNEFTWDWLVAAVGDALPSVQPSQTSEEPAQRRSRLLFIQVLGRAAELRTASHRERALWALERRWEALHRAEGQPREERLLILGALRGAATARALPLLEEGALQSRLPVERRLGLAALRALPTGTRGLVPLLVRSLDDPDPLVRREAAAALVSAPQSPGSETIAHDLPVEQTLVARLERDPWPSVRAAVVAALRTRCASPLAHKALAGRVLSSHAGRSSGDEDEEVRRAALEALDHCDPHSPLVPQLLESRAPASVRALAALLVGRRPGAAEEQALRAALERALGEPPRGPLDARDPEEPVARAAIRALGGRGSVEDRSLEALRDAALDPFRPAVRSDAVEAVGRLCPPGAHALLRRSADDPEPAVRRSAALAARRCVDRPLNR